MVLDYFNIQKREYQQIRTYQTEKVKNYPKYQFKRG